MKRSLYLAMTALIVAAAGCGQSDKEKIRSTVQSYIDGLASRDGKKVCDQLAGSVKTLVTQRGSTKDCATAINRFEASATGRAVAPAFKTAEITEIKTKGNTATATVALKTVQTSPTIPLEKINGSWKITSTAGG